MEKYVGKSVFGGIAIGKIIVHGIDEQTVRHMQIDNPAQEKERYHQAVKTAVTQLDQLYDKALREVGKESAAIFRTHQMMLRDDDYT